MRYRLTARHFTPSERLKQYVQKEVNRLERYYRGIIDCEVILDEEKLNKIAEIQLKVNGTLLTAAERSDDIFKSVDLAVEKIERQLKKYKGKLQNYEGERVGKLLSQKEAESRAEETEEVA